MNWAHLLPLLGFVVVPTAAGFLNYTMARKKESYKGQLHLPSLINSAVLFALAYNLVFFIQELFLVLGKNSIGLKAVLYHNNHSWEGFHTKESLMQGSGALAIFCLGLILLMVLPFINKTSWSRIFIIWLAFNGIMQSLPQFATAGMAPETDTGQALQYLAPGTETTWVITGLSYLMMVAALLFFPKLLLTAAPDGSTPLKRFYYLRQIVLWGGLAAVLLIIPFRIPPASRIMAVVFLVMLCLPLMMAFGWKMGPVQGSDNTINQKVLWLPILMLLLLLLFFQLVLAPGLVFYP